MKVEYKGSNIINELKDPNQLIEMKNGEVWKISNINFINNIEEFDPRKFKERIRVKPIKKKVDIKQVEIFEMFSGNRTPMFSLKKIGIDPISIGFSEIKKSAIEISKLNFPDDINLGDCTKIDPKKIGNFDLLTAGFPCQDVSVCGKNDLSLGRTILYDEIIRIADYKRPKYMVLENVKGILQKKHRDFFNHVLKEIERIGYLCNYKVLNSKEHGIPQNRERVWFICFRKDLINEYKNFKFPEKEDLKLEVKNLMDLNIDRIYPKNKRLGMILDSPTGKENPCFELKGDTPSGLSRQSDRIYTSISPCLNTVQKELIFNIENESGNNELMVLTGREHMRLMGFLEDEIKLEGMSENAIKDLAGDGWDMNLTSKIFKELFKK